MTTQEVRKARKGPMIAKMDENSLIGAMHAMLLDVCRMNGRSDDMAIWFDGLAAQDLRANYPWLTLDEVQLALHYGTLEEFGKNYSVTYSTIIGWVRSYAGCSQRLYVLGEERKARVAAKVAEAPPRSARDLYDGNVAALARRCESARGGTCGFEVPRVGAMVFDWLRAEGSMPVDGRAWQEAVRAAKAEGDTRPGFVASLGGEASGEALRDRAKNTYLRTWLRGLYAAGKSPVIPEFSGK